MSRISSVFNQNLYTFTERRGKKTLLAQTIISIISNFFLDWHSGCINFLVLLKDHNSTKICPYNLCEVSEWLCQLFLCLSLYKQIKIHTVVKLYFSSFTQKNWKLLPMQDDRLLERLLRENIPIPH